MLLMLMLMLRRPSYWLLGMFSSGGGADGSGRYRSWTNDFCAGGGVLVLLAEREGAMLQVLQLLDISLTHSLTHLAQPLHCTIDTHKHISPRRSPRRPAPRTAFSE